MSRKSGPWDEIGDAIGHALGRATAITARHPLGGGCINTAARLETTTGEYFAKLNEPGFADMFAAEAEGLRELAVPGAVRVPGVICHGTAAGGAFLVLEYLDLSDGDGRSAERLGRGLAALHRATSAAFGWKRNNTIGSTPQINTPSGDWVGFWRERRLGYQLTLAARRGLGGAIVRRGEQLLGSLDGLFTGYRPVPSLLHGDLWGGNQAALADGTPVIFDPAVYYGDREADLAMTELFGGFSGNFYCAYREAWPLDDGYALRKTLYNLYHVLNHYNLFGGGYGAQAGRMIDTLLSGL
jgi:fructosamine-3-kinase